MTERRPAATGFHEMAQRDWTIFVPACYFVISGLFLIAFFDPTFGETAAAVGRLFIRSSEKGIPTIYPALYGALHFLPIIYAINLIRTQSEAELGAWRAILWMAVSIGILVLPATFLADLLLGPASGSGMLHNLSLFFLLLACLRAVSRQELARISRRLSTFLIIPFGASIFSLAVMISAAVGAHLIAGDNKYCIATADYEGRDYGPIASWQELRGSELATDKTGYKDTSRWYFHAVLLSEERSSIGYWNWSFLQFQWVRTEADNFIVSIEDACEPSAEFLSGLRLIAAPNDANE